MAFPVYLGIRTDQMEDINGKKTYLALEHA